MRLEWLTDYARSIEGRFQYILGLHRCDEVKEGQPLYCEVMFKGRTEDEILTSVIITIQEVKRWRHDVFFVGSMLPDINQDLSRQRSELELSDIDLERPIIVHGKISEDLNGGAGPSHLQKGSWIFLGRNSLEMLVVEDNDPLRESFPHLPTPVPFANYAGENAEITFQDGHILRIVPQINDSLVIGTRYIFLIKDGVTIAKIGLDTRKVDWRAKMRRMAEWGIDIRGMIESWWHLPIQDEATPMIHRRPQDDYRFLIPASECEGVAGYWLAAILWAQENYFYPTESNAKIIPHKMAILFRSLPYLRTLLETGKFK